MIFLDVYFYSFWIILLFYSKQYHDNKYSKTIKIGTSLSEHVAQTRRTKTTYTNTIYVTKENHDGRNILGGNRLM